MWYKVASAFVEWSSQCEGQTEVCRVAQLRTCFPDEVVRCMCIKAKEADLINIEEMPFCISV